VKVVLKHEATLWLGETWIYDGLTEKACSFYQHTKQMTCMLCDITHTQCEIIPSGIFPAVLVLSKCSTFVVLVVKDLCL